MNPRTRLYLKLYRNLERGFRLVKGAFEGVALALLDQQALHEVDEEYYDQQLIYLDETYNDGGLFPWETRAVERYFAGRRRLLVTAAGAGREVLALEKLGYEVHGFECHPRLRARGNELMTTHGLTARLHPMERDTAPPPGPEPYDGIIVGWGSYTHMRGRDARISMLRGLRRQAASDAPVLLSFWLNKGQNRYLPWIRQVGRAARWLGGTQGVELGDALNPDFVHRFTEQEIENELSAGGFELIVFDDRDFGHAIGTAR